MTAYLFELSAYWAAFYLLYVAVLGRQTFFRLNRAYLLLAFGLGLLLPFLDFPVAAAAPEGLSGFWLPAAEISRSLQGTTQEAVSSPAGGIAWWLLLWVAGAVVAAARTLTGLWQISTLLEKSRKEYRRDYVLVRTEQVHLPFSFGPYLFWSDRFEPEPGEARQILRHEEAHIRQRHSLDIVLLELAGIFLWWHPLVYGYRRSIRQVHEYLADAAVLEETPRKEYGMLLLLRLRPGLQPAVANHFLRSQLKSRLLMMTRSQSARRATLCYLLALPLLGLLFWACNTEPELMPQDSPAEEGAATLAYTQRDTVIMLDPETYDESMTVVERDVFKVVEEMPRFPGCEEAGLEEEERSQCAQVKLLDFIADNIRYPEAAHEQKVEGAVVVRFVVNPNGQVSDAEIVKSLGGGCDEEVLRIVNAMPQWIPGRQRGKAVAVQFNLPVQFRLQ